MRIFLHTLRNENLKRLKEIEKQKENKKISRKKRKDTKLKKTVKEVSFGKSIEFYSIFFKKNGVESILKNKNIKIEDFLLKDRILPIIKEAVQLDMLYYSNNTLHRVPVGSANVDKFKFDIPHYGEQGFLGSSVSKTKFSITVSNSAKISIGRPLDYLITHNGSSLELDNMNFKEFKTFLYKSKISKSEMETITSLLESFVKIQNERDNSYKNNQHNVKMVTIPYQESFINIKILEPATIVQEVMESVSLRFYNKGKDHINRFAVSEKFSHIGQLQNIFPFGPRNGFVFKNRDLKIRFKVFKAEDLLDQKYIFDKINYECISKKDKDILSLYMDKKKAQEDYRYWNNILRSIAQRVKDKFFSRVPDSFTDLDSLDKAIDLYFEKKYHFKGVNNV